MADVTRELRGAIFDMDGVIVVNMHFHEQAFDELARRRGKEITREFFFEHICGSTNPKIMPKIFGELSPEEVETLSIEKEALYRELFLPHMKPTPGLIDYLENLKSKGIPMSIASNAPKENVDFVVEKLGLDRYFSHVLHVSSVSNPKPAPDMFLKCAELMGVDPHHTVVFEDAPSGIRAAKQAGMLPVALLTTHEQHEFPEPHIFITDFTHPSSAFLIPPPLTLHFSLSIKPD
ncbi:MAG: hypothetical protein A3D92_07975 [Bacteroidetes bacterium RIFCSPHIGHO2_02_FULL_44_7]|nr:MAG: hypothetical protein A3D92_07975 [Bacteroidetes bacterium RIFCSPHIGHO2_02_FULL_44_7]